MYKVYVKNLIYKINVSLPSPHIYTLKYTHKHANVSKHAALPEPSISDKGYTVPKSKGNQTINTSSEQMIRGINRDQEAVKELQAATLTTTKASRLTNHNTDILNLAKTNETCCIYSTGFLLLAHSQA